MKFGMTPSPFQRSPRKTLHIMLELSLALVVLWIAAIVKNFVSYGTAYGINAIVMGIVALLSALVADILVATVQYKPVVGEKLSPFKAYVKYTTKFVVRSFSYVTALILFLSLPVATPIYAVVLGTFFAVIIVKALFGGFGYNLFNPAAMTRAFLALSFASTMVTYLNSTDQADFGATPLATLAKTFLAGNFTINFQQLNLTLGDIYLGNYLGALGETFSLLIIVLGIVLAIRKVLDWRLPVFYVSTIAIIAFAFALINGLDPILYTSVQVGLGGVLFAAVFMVTDPVTSPTSRYGKVLFAVIAGALTFMIRTLSNYPEGVMYAIILANMLTPLIDRLISGMTTKHLVRRWATIGSIVLVAGSLNVAVMSTKAANEKPIVLSPFVSISYQGQGVYEVIELTHLDKEVVFHVSVDLLNNTIVKIEGIYDQETTVNENRCLDTYFTSLFTNPSICENEGTVQFYEDFFLTDLDLSLEDAIEMGENLGSLETFGATYTTTATRDALYQVALAVKPDNYFEKISVESLGEGVYRASGNNQFGLVSIDVTVDLENEKVISVVDYATQQMPQDDEEYPIPDVFDGYHLTNYIGAVLDLSFEDLFANDFISNDPAKYTPEDLRIEATWTSKTTVLLIQAAVFKAIAESEGE